jgi:protein TonB
MITKKYSLSIPYTKYALSLAFSLCMVCAAFSQQTANTTTKKAFTEVDQMPQFPGCSETEQEAQAKCSHKKFLTFIYENLKYPKEDADKGVEGLVLLNFVVTAKGKIKDISTKKSLSKACDAEGMRVVELMNEKGVLWSPGIKDGKAVDVVLTLPLKFKLQ